MSFGEKLRALRKGKGLSQEGLGNLIGVHLNTIHKWEQLPRLNDLDRLEQLASIFGVSVENLTEGAVITHSPPPPNASPVEEGAIDPTLDPRAPSAMSQRAGELFFKNGDTEIRMPDNPENQKIFYRIVERMLDSLSVPAPKEETPADLPVSVGASRSA